MNNRSLPAWAAVLPLTVGVACVYYASARLGLLLAFEKTNASPIWPPSGIALAAVLIFGYRSLPGIALGAFAANLVVFVSNQAAGLSTVVSLSVCIAVGNTVEALSGGILVGRWIGRASPLARARSVFIFIIAALLMCVTSSMVGAASLSLFGVVPWATFSTIWFTWWLGDVAGVLILTPLLLTWWKHRDQPRVSRTLLEAVALFTTLFALGQLTFESWWPTGILHSQVYLLIPILLWSAFRFGAREVTLAILTVSGIAIWATVRGYGPFFHEDSLNTSLLLLQSFVGVVAVTMLSLVSVLSERRHAGEELVAVNETLEQRVTDRTAKLARANSDLQGEVAERVRVEGDLRELNESLEQRVAERTAALENRSHELSELNTALVRANKELEDVSYIVSHDLKAPLRAISSLASWLEQDYREIIDEEGQETLQLLTGRVSRMNNLIEGVLGYARIGRTTPRLAPQDSHRIVTEVIESLDTPEKATVHIDGELPTVVYDETHLVQLFQNLIDNAIKHSGTPRAEVSVSSREYDGVWEFSVRDSGAGIPEEHFERIFKVFQTLRPRDELECTGVGLSIVKKIAEWHGGSVTLRSVVGEGSEFAFTIPKGLQASPEDR